MVKNRIFDKKTMTPFLFDFFQNLAPILFFRRI